MHGVPCGGWCPKGRKAEDGPIDLKYPLKETPSESYIQRTEWNVRDSDATILLSIEPTLTGGSLRTLEFAGEHKKPCQHLYAGDVSGADKLKAFIDEHGVKVLNVAGPRAGEIAPRNAQTGQNSLFSFNSVPQTSQARLLLVFTPTSVS